MRCGKCHALSCYPLYFRTGTKIKENNKASKIDNRGEKKRKEKREKDNGKEGPFFTAIDKSGKNRQIWVLAPNKLFRSYLR